MNRRTFTLALAGLPLPIDRRQLRAVFGPYGRTYTSYPEAAISPRGDWVYFLARKTIVREWHNPKYPESREQLAGEIQKDDVWLKRVRLADNRVESLHEWTAGSAGTNYETFGPDPTVPRADLTWETDHELAYDIQLDVAPWYKTLSGIWDTNAGKLATLDRHMAFGNNSQASRLHGDQEVIIAQNFDGPAAIVIYERLTPKATVYAVSSGGKFKMNGRMSLLRLAVASSRRESIETRSREGFRL